MKLKRGGRPTHRDCRMVREAAPALAAGAGGGGVACEWDSQGFIRKGSHCGRDSLLASRGPSVWSENQRGTRREGV